MTPFTRGVELSFSAGARLDAALEYRVLHGGHDRFAQAFSFFPELSDCLMPLPLVINDYPVSLGPVASACMCQTHTRQVTFSHALRLAAERAMPAVILGQPLLVAEHLTQHLTRGLAVPDTVIMAVGGYVCPDSLETYLLRRLRQRGTRAQLLHAYGTAGTDFAVLIGRRSALGRVQYRHVARHVAVKVDDGRLWLSAVDGAWHDTGDYASLAADTIEIDSCARTASGVLAQLQSWGCTEWTRRTGYMSVDSSGRTQWQLRPGAASQGADELPYGAFIDRFGITLPEKPDWTGR